MNRKLVILSIMLITLLLAAGSIFAQNENEEAKTEGENVALYLASAFGMSFVSAFGALAMGLAVRGFCDGVARNPGAADKLQFGLILTLVLIETLALYVLAVIFVKVV